MLAVYDRKFSPFDWGHDNGRKFRPIEILRYVLYVDGSATADAPLVSRIDYQEADFEPTKHWCGAGIEL